MLGQLRNHTGRCTVSQREADIAASTGCSDVAQPLSHESVVAQICLRVIVRENKGHEDGQTELIRGRDRSFQGMIVGRALRPLHPVEHELAAFRGVAAAGPACAARLLVVKLAHPRLACCKLLCVQSPLLMEPLYMGSPCLRA